MSEAQWPHGWCAGLRIEQSWFQSCGPFLKAPGNYRACFKAVFFSIPDESFKSFENYTVKLLAKETKWNSLEVRTHSTFLETLISKCDFGPVTLSGLWRNGPLTGDIMSCSLLPGACMGTRKLNAGGNWWTGIPSKGGVDIVMRSHTDFNWPT